MNNYCLKNQISLHYLKCFVLFKFQTAEETKAAYEKLQEQYDEAKKKFEILKTEAENEINRYLSFLCFRHFDSCGAIGRLFFARIY